MIPPSKRFDIFPPDWGMLRKSRCLQIFLLKVWYKRKIKLKIRFVVVISMKKVIVPSTLLYNKGE